MPSSALPVNPHVRPARRVIRALSNIHSYQELRVGLKLDPVLSDVLGWFQQLSFCWTHVL